MPVGEKEMSRARIMLRAMRMLSTTMTFSEVVRLLFRALRFAIYVSLERQFSV